MGPIDARKVVEVALEPDEELRNQQVALLYSITSGRLREKLAAGNPRRRDVINWFTVAQWAVLTVGRNIRLGDPPARTRNLPPALRNRVTPAIVRLRAASDRRVAEALSIGQLKVFLSIYAELLRHPELRDEPDASNGPTLTFQTTYVLADGATPPDPPPDHSLLTSVAESGDSVTNTNGSADAPSSADPVATSPTGQVAPAEVTPIVKRLASDERARREWILGRVDELVQTTRPTIPLEEPGFYDAVLDTLADWAGHRAEVAEAVAHYRHATSSDETDFHHRVFAANVRLSGVEQLNVQDAVTTVIDHVPRHVLERVESRVLAFADRTLRLDRRTVGLGLSRPLLEASRMAHDMWARFMTDQVLVIALPAETVRLGRDIPMRDWARGFVAPQLRRLSGDAEILRARFDRSLGDGRGSGAADWRRWDDRMNFIVNFMRSRHDDTTLFWAPFTSEDAERVWHGRYPERFGDPLNGTVRRTSAAERSPQVEATR